MHVGHSPRRKPALPVPTATGERVGIGLGDMGRLKLWGCQGPQQRREVLPTQLGVTFMRPGRDLSLHVLDPAFEEGRDGHARGVDVGAVLQLGDQAGGLDLRLSLGARKGMPTAFAIAGLRIARVNHDGPVTGRAFAKMPPHFESSLSVAGCSLAKSRRSPGCCAAHARISGLHFAGSVLIIPKIFNVWSMVSISASALSSRRNDSS